MINVDYFHTANEGSFRNSNYGVMFRCLCTEVWSLVLPAWLCCWQTGVVACYSRRCSLIKCVCCVLPLPLQPALTWMNSKWKLYKTISRKASRNLCLWGKKNGRCGASWSSWGGECWREWNHLAFLREVIRFFVEISQCVWQYQGQPWSLKDILSLLGRLTGIGRGFLVAWLSDCKQILFYIFNQRPVHYN